MPCVWNDNNQILAGTARSLYADTAASTQHLVFLLDGNHLSEGTHLPLHAVDALYNDQHLLPGLARPGLPIRYALLQQLP